MGALPDPTPVDMAQAREVLRLYRDERLTQRELAVRYGVAQPTIARWVKLAREDEVWIDIIDRAEERGWTADLYREVIAKILSWLDGVDGHEEGLPILDRVLKFTKAHRELHGLDAPTRIAIGDDKVSAVPDAGLLRAVRAMRDRDALDTRELNAGRPGVIEGGGQGNG